MRFEGPITGILGRMLLDRARRPDLAAKGLEVDDATLERHRILADKAHPQRSADERNAIAWYAAYFDRDAPHNVSKGIEVQESGTPQETHQTIWNAVNRNHQATRERIDYHLDAVYQAMRDQGADILTAVRETSTAIESASDLRHHKIVGLAGESWSQTQRVIAAIEHVKSGIADFAEAESSRAADLSNRDRFLEWQRWGGLGLLVIIAGELAWSLIR